VKDLVNRALDAAQRAGAAYADVRVVERETESLTVKNGALESAAAHRTAGMGVRLLVDGGWGFSASSLLEPIEAERIAREAAEIARASAGARREPIVLDGTPPAQGSYRTLVREDPFAVSLDEKLGILLASDEAMGRVPGVTVREGSMEWSRERKTFVSSEGANLEQEIVEAGAGIEATAVDEGEVQVRSFPQMGGQLVTAGFEAVRALDLAGNAQRVAEEAVALLTAPQCPSGEMDLILESSQLALQIHESCGHPIELDRVLGMEASFAGTSFLTLDRLDQLQYGSSIVHIDADATAPGGLGTFGWDDEGVPAQDVPIVSAGLLVGYLTNRETAPRIGRQSMGSARASGWDRIPIIRMTNVSLRPGPEATSLDDLIADTREGIYLETNRSWSIDDRRLNFQFGTQAGWLIRDGRRTQLVRNPTYTGITPRFWGSCDAIAGPREWVLWGVPNCGKGEPMQTGHVSHGASPARFRKVQVGVGRW